MYIYMYVYLCACIYIYIHMIMYEYVLNEENKKYIYIYIQTDHEFQQRSTRLHAYRKTQSGAGAKCPGEAPETAASNKEKTGTMAICSKWLVVKIMVPFWVP